ncbi:MAG: YiiX/YebB-like N1pC/P60 family cysteine hydrolase [Methanospirillum sp.]
MIASALLLPVAAVGASPNIAWVHTYGENRYDGFKSVQQTADGGYILAGWLLSTDGDAIDKKYAWIVKLDGTGTLEWQRQLGSNMFQSLSIRQTTDGGYILAGMTSDPTVPGYHVFHDIYDNRTVFCGDMWVAKLDAAGGLVWQRALGGSAVEDAFSVQQTADGGYILAGWLHSTDGDVTGHHGGSSDAWVVKLNDVGGLVWQRALGGSSGECAYSIQQTADGGYVVAGYTGSTDGDVTGYPDGRGPDVWAVKLNATGGLVWQKRLGGTGNDIAYSVQQTADGGYILAGETHSTDGDVTGYHGDYDAWAVKLNDVGGLVWQRALGGSGDDIAYSVQQTADGGYVVAGWTFSTDGDVTGYHGGQGDAWAVKLNDMGGLVWQKCLGGTGGEWANSVQQTADGGYVVAGITDSTDGDITGNSSSSDGMVVKLDPPGLAVESITPTFCTPGSDLISVTVEGTNFADGASFKLVNASLGTITCLPSTTTWVSDTELRGQFSFTSAQPGHYDVVVTNPGGETASLANGFNVGGVPPSVTAIQPAEGTEGDGEVDMSVHGFDFQDGASFALVNVSLGTLACIPSTLLFHSETELSGKIDLTVAKPGLYDVVVTNPDGTTGTLEKGFRVRPVAAFKSYNIEDIGSGEVRTEGHHMAGGRFEFDASESIDPDSGPLEYRWEIRWDNGESVQDWTSSPKFVTTLYQPEKITVNLTVRDHQGNTNTATEELDLTLDPGDLIVIRSGQPYAGIFDCLGMDYTHIGIYVGKVNGRHMVVESAAGRPPLSLAKGVQVTPIERWGWNHETYVDRIQINTDDGTKADAVDFALSLASDLPQRGYDFEFQFKEEGGTPVVVYPWYNYYCSELVWACYYHANRSVDLSIGAKQPLECAVSPDDIYRSQFAIKGENWHHEWSPPKFFGLFGSLIISTDCPVEIIVTDPSGKTISNESSQIPDAYYFHTDLNGDGNIDDGVYIQNRTDGRYSIRVVPEPGASLNDTYTLRAQSGNTTTILADTIQIRNLPSEPYTYTEGNEGVLALPGASNLPTDLNGDGLYDDVNGNSRPDFADVVLYFNQMTWIAGNEPVVAFDCNANGRIDFADVVWLFNNL